MENAMRMTAIAFAAGMFVANASIYAQEGDILNSPLRFESPDAQRSTAERSTAETPSTREANRTGIDQLRYIDLSQTPLDRLRELAPQIAEDVKFLRRCGTHIDPASKRAVRIASSLRLLTAGLDELPQNIKVPVRFHVIHDGNNGKLTVAQVQAQIAKLNEAYFSFHIQFELQGDPDYADNDTWFRMRVSDSDQPPFPEEREAKEHFVGTDPDHSVERNLHIYSAQPRDPEPQIGDILGFATFPWDRQANGAIDGVVIRHSSIPGGQSPYDLGLTLVHEVGHYLGLYHTFQDGCGNQGDEVSDTPAQSDGNNIFECDESLDSCPEESGLDPVHNYMNYVADACMHEFTAGQLTRMRTMVQLYRPEFITAGP